ITALPVENRFGRRREVERHGVPASWRINPEAFEDIQYVASAQRLDRLDPRRAGGRAGRPGTRAAPAGRARGLGRAGNGHDRSEPRYGDPDNAEIRRPPYRARSGGEGGDAARRSPATRRGGTSPPRRSALRILAAAEGRPGFGPRAKAPSP